MKFKKCISAFLVSALILTSFALPTGFTSYATENEETKVAEEQAETDEVQETEQESEKETEQAAEIDAETPEADNTVGKEADSTVKQEETEEKNVPQGRSLLPLEEVNAYLILTGYSKEEIKSMKVEKVLSLLQDNEGNFIGNEIDPNASVVWAQMKDESGNFLYDEYHKIARDETIDLSPLEGQTDYQMELIVGSGNQLDSGNKRYIVKVYISDKPIEENLQFEVYAEYGDGSREKVEPMRVDFSEVLNAWTDSAGKAHTLWAYGYTVGEVVECERSLLNIISTRVDHPDITAEIYKFDEYRINDLLGIEIFPPITDQILNQDMSKSDTGYQYKNDTNIFVVKYYFDGIEFETNLVGVLVAGGYMYNAGNLYESNDETQRSIIYDTNYYVNGNSSSYEYELEPGFSADEKYEFHLDLMGPKNENFNKNAVKAVVGNYASLEETQNVKDIKEQLLGEGKGYIDNYGGEGVEFTIFFEEGTFWNKEENIQHVKIKVIDYNEEFREFDDSPIVGERDPWFRVTGAKSVEDEGVLDTYIVENGKEINMDTMYGYGYQTVLINLEEKIVKYVLCLPWQIREMLKLLRFMSMEEKNIR